jgi:hypothetical protein
VLSSAGDDIDDKLRVDSGGGPSCRNLVPTGDVGMGTTEIQLENSSEIASGTESGVALGLSSSGNVSSHLPLIPSAEFVALPSPDAFVLLSSNLLGVGAGCLNLSSLFLLSQERLSWVRRFVLLSLCYSLLNLSKDIIGRLGISRKVTQ